MIAKLSHVLKYAGPVLAVMAALIEVKALYDISNATDEDIQAQTVANFDAMKKFVQDLSNLFNEI